MKAEGRVRGKIGRATLRGAVRGWRSDALMQVDADGSVGTSLYQSAEGRLRLPGDSGTNSLPPSPWLTSFRPLQFLHG